MQRLAAKLVLNPYLVKRVAMKDCLRPPHPMNGLLEAQRRAKLIGSLATNPKNCRRGVPVVEYRVHFPEDVLVLPIGSREGLAKDSGWTRYLPCVLDRHTS